jgi:two-component system response regulator DesR
VIRVLLADDQAMVRGALAAMLGLENDIEIVAQVGSGDQVVAAAQEAKPDVALLDVQMPGCDGIEAAARLNSALPSCRVVILTTFGRPGYLSRAMRAGASGFVVKDSPSSSRTRSAGCTPGSGSSIPCWRPSPCPADRAR